MVLLYSLFLTIALEGVVFYIFGFKKRDFFVVFLLINAITNLFINITVGFASVIITRPLLIFLLYSLETAAIFVEYLFFTKIEGKSMKLLLCTFLANIVSYTSGLLIFGHI